MAHTTVVFSAEVQKLFLRVSLLIGGDISIKAIRELNPDSLSHVATKGKKTNLNLCFYGDSDLLMLQAHEPHTHCTLHCSVLHHSDMPCQQLEFQRMCLSVPTSSFCVCECEKERASERERDSQIPHQMAKCQ